MGMEKSVPVLLQGENDLGIPLRLSLPSFYEQTSQLVAPIDNHNTLGEVDPLDHGFGPVQVSRQALVELDSRIVATAKTFGDQFPLNLDVNSGDTVGIGV